MNTIQIELAPELGQELQRIGVVENPRLSEWIAEAIRQKLSSDMQLKYLENRASRRDRAKFLEVLSRVPAVEPAENDR